MATWQDLQQLRAQGIKPTLPVIVTTGHWQMERNLREVGCMTITHKPGQPLPAKLLQGLRVWLFVGNCDRRNNVARVLAANEAQPAQLLAWCDCTKTLTQCGAVCERNRDWK